MKDIPASVLTLIAGILVTLISLWVGQHHGLLPEQASAQAPLVDGFFNVMVTIATALFLVVEGTILLFVFKFRRRQADDTDGEPIEGNVPLEIFWTAIPAIIVVGLGVYSVEVYSEMGGFAPAAMPGMVAHHHTTPSALDRLVGSAIAAPLNTESEQSSGEQPIATTYGIGATPEMGTKPADLTVNVLGMQYAWIFTYADSNITTGELHVPVGADVQLNLAAQDVIHSFWVPQFRLKQDAIPGQPTELRFVATKPGTYPVVCAELCGGYHGSMRSQVVVHTPEDFEQWQTENQMAQAQGTLQTVAIAPHELSPSEFLAPYAQDLGVETATLAQLHSH